MRSWVYQDRPIPVGEGRSIPSLGAQAALIDALRMVPGERVLEVGTGTGYAAAVLATMGARVDTVERLPRLAAAAAERLAALELDVATHCGDGFEGWDDRAPFDAILVSAGAHEVPAKLLQQLAPGGRLVIPTRPHEIRQTVLRFTKDADGHISEEPLGELAFVTLLGDILVEMGAATRQSVEKAAAKPGALGDALVGLGALSETDLYRALALQRGLPLGHVESLLTDADPMLAAGVSRAFLEHNRMVPLARRDGRLLVATSDPEASVADLAKAFPSRRVELQLVTPTDYRRLWAALDLWDPVGDLPREKPEADPRAADLLDSRVDPDAEGRNRALFEAILLDAVGARASDIHFEVYGESVRLRLRIDGEMRDLTHITMTREQLSAVLNVLKVSSHLDIAERRLPQGGRFRTRVGDRTFDLRVQTQPSLYGEHAVIRLLPQDENRLPTIEDLGFSKEIATRYRRLLDSPSGLILVVGPTGSGKSTTLYAGLQVLARDATRKIITVEDPIEYALRGVQQAQVRPHLGFAFANAMRAFVRQDPDVILVGEIRDGETALEAIRASQTGHVVLSTLHCNDTIDTVQRLIDLGMHPNSIASEILAIFAQRLARRICDGCRRPAELDPTLVSEVFPQGPPPGFQSYVGAGCERCTGRGTYGRIAVVELLEASPGLRHAIAHRLSVDELREVVEGDSLHSLRKSALELVAAGKIPFAELRRLLPPERLAPSTGRADIHRVGPRRTG